MATFRSRPSISAVIAAGAAILGCAGAVSSAASLGFVRREDQGPRSVRVEPDGHVLDAAQVPSDNDPLLHKSSRREVQVTPGAEMSSAQLLGAAGVLAHRSPTEQDPQEAMVKANVDDTLAGDVPSQCDRQFVLMAEGADNCTGFGDPKEVFYKGDCMHASAALGISMAPKFLLDTYEVDPLPYPRGCFLNTSTNLIHLNPEELDSASGKLTGKKICMRNVYINGTKNVAQPSTACIGDAAPILNFQECWAAALCAAGGMACKIQEFQDNVTSYKPQDRPQGCFKDAIGCWGFNYLDEAPSGAINGTAVCKNSVPPPR